MFSYGLETSSGLLKSAILSVRTNNSGTFNLGKGNGLFTNSVEFLNGVILELHLTCLAHAMLV